MDGDRPTIVAPETEFTWHLTSPPRRPIPAGTRSRTGRPPPEASPGPGRRPPGRRPARRRTRGPGTTTWPGRSDRLRRGRPGARARRAAGAAAGASAPRPSRCSSACRRSHSGWWRSCSRRASRTKRSATSPSGHRRSSAPRRSRAPQPPRPRRLPPPNRPLRRRRRWRRRRPPPRRRAPRPWRPLRHRCRSRRHPRPRRRPARHRSRSSTPPAGWSHRSFSCRHRRAWARGSSTTRGDLFSPPPMSSRTPNPSPTCSPTRGRVGLGAPRGLRSTPPPRWMFPMPWEGRCPMSSSNSPTVFAPAARCWRRTASWTWRSCRSTRRSTSRPRR